MATRRRSQIDLQAERGPATIEEVAVAAQVSKTTVSHALGGNRPVAAATHARIERAIEELGYRPSAVARSCKLARSSSRAREPVFVAVAHELIDRNSA